MKTKLLLFCSSNYYNINRINKDLIDNKYKLFNEVKLLNEHDLDDNIKVIINNIIAKYGNKGYGYWIWKPYIILQELNKLNNDDILVHLDCHCKLNKLKNKFNRIKNYLNNSNKPLIIAKIGFNDYMYTTKKLLNVIETYLNYNFSESEMKMTQYEAGILFMRKNNFTINFFTQYFDIMIDNNEDKYQYMLRQEPFYKDPVDVYRDFSKKLCKFIEDRI